MYESVNFHWVNSEIRIGNITFVVAKGEYDKIQWKCPQTSRTLFTEEHDQCIHFK